MPFTRPDYLRPDSVYTDPRIVNSINSALRLGYRVIAFETPHIGDLVMHLDGRLERFTVANYDSNHLKGIRLLIWGTPKYAHDILEGRF